jgi:tRNA 2-thiouridine synthesizing protein A
MATQTLDITGKVCPYCTLAVQKVTKTLKTGDVLVVTCDHPSAATSSIPQFAAENGMVHSSRKIESGVWEITLTKK